MVLIIAKGKERAVILWGDDDGGSAHSRRDQYFRECCAGSGCGAQDWQQAALSGEAKSVGRLQARRNDQGCKALGWRLHIITA
jgi:hypothetical protein